MTDIPQDWNDDPEDERLARAWHDYEVVRGKAYPVLFYTVKREHRWQQPADCLAETEPCIWCGKRHRHGNMPGSRVPHCGQHTHEFTPTGRRRSPYVRGVRVCRSHHRDYILKELTA